MKLHTVISLLLVLLFSASPSACLADDGFAPLFNGRDLTGWEGVGGKGGGNWRVRDGLLECTGGAGAQWLAATGEVADFELLLDFNLPANGNSGVFIRAPKEGAPWVMGMEIQLLDDAGPKWKDLKPDQFTGAIYGAIAPERRVTKPAGEWQTLRVRCVGRSCVVWVNGEKVVDVDLDELAKTSGKKVPGLKRNTGLIGLQNHGDPVSFRNIRLRRVDVPGS